MRIRQVKPSFWSDSLLSSIPEATRLFYIGLWMLADDAGWITWDTSEAALALYGYETRARREKRVQTMLLSLRDIGRVTIHPCGHVEVPKLAEHQRLASPEKQVKTTLREHQKQCIPAVPRESPQVPADARVSPARNGIGKGTVGNGTERIGTVGAQERETTGESEFQARVPRPNVHDILRTANAKGKAS